MRVALLLRGITYKESYRHHTGAIMKVDYKDNISNVMNQIIEPLRAQHEVDLYITTYDSVKKNEVINDFNPKAIIFLDPNENQVTSTKEGLKLIKQSRNDYDFVIVTRMDLFFLLDLTKVPYDINKFNFIWEENPQEDNNCVGDSLHVFNIRFIDEFIYALEEYTFLLNLHKIREKILKYISKKDIHYMFPPVFDSNSDNGPNPLYIIKRSINNPKPPENQGNQYQFRWQRLGRGSMRR